MDGLDENPGANSSNHISNTDTSQDELDAHSPSGRYMGGNKQRLGRVKGAGVDGSAVHRSPQATHINLGELARTAVGQLASTVAELSLMFNLF